MRNDECRRIAVIAASFVSQPLHASVSFWLSFWGLTDTVELDDDSYGSVLPTLLQPGSSFYRRTDGLNVVLFRFHDWTGDSGSSEVLLRTIGEFVSAVRQYADRTDAKLLILRCAESIKRAELEEAYAVATALLRDMRLPSVQFYDCFEYEQVYSIVREQELCEETDEIAHVPYSLTYYALLGTLISRHLRCVIEESRFKVIVCDCDQTLWAGVVNEDLACVEVSGGHLLLQQLLVQLCNGGKVICLASKNDECDVLNVLSAVDMPLKRQHITQHKIN